MLNKTKGMSPSGITDPSLWGQLQGVGWGKKSDLIQMYWLRHEDVVFEVYTGMKISRYFGDDLYDGEIIDFVDGMWSIQYEDDDTDLMDLE